jgi:hypothetical protein
MTMTVSEEFNSVVSRRSAFVSRNRIQMAVQEFSVQLWSVIQRTPEAEVTDS